MAEPTLGVCAPWIDADDVRRCCDGLDPAFDLTLAIEFATDILFRLSGRQFPGVCPRTLRPCFGSNCGCGGENWGMFGSADWWYPTWSGFWQFPSWPYRMDGQWFNTGCCGGRCYIPCVLLPDPVTNVIEVVIDGVVLPAVDLNGKPNYKVQEFRRVCRTDGGHWPCGNDMARESSPYPGPNDGSRAGTWEITIDWGRGPGRAGKYAAAIFACQIAKNQCGSDDCVLPQRLKSITREGVSMAFADPLDFLDNNRVGLYEVDLWLSSVNRMNLQRRSTVRRVDEPRNFREFT